ncbi:ATP-dependent bile acid permease [Fusarium oxysporum f. sp. albedinis]|nr:ATP-dependent bile acid permease [Fusarium oxysporum f. sp. albedinis]
MTPNTHITTAQLLKLAEADVSMPIPAADTATILSILSFLNLSGTFNPRELGLVAGSPIRPGYAYRCGSLEGLDANGKLHLSIHIELNQKEAEGRVALSDPGYRTIQLPCGYGNLIKDSKGGLSRQSGV